MTPHPKSGIDWDEINAAREAFFAEWHAQHVRLSACPCCGQSRPGHLQMYDDGRIEFVPALQPVKHDPESQSGPEPDGEG